ncbi:hypothetical protein [Yoonia litorea]|uniref:Uncharacterized protein n=1 Tax=Yoonia litorea TaxID=1123755 RepID=A0A1I6MUV4_9RHOB|nr:hypothetical protein [Yoonia litorea]SFS19419.1 hypothetical protein SAMN05444714_2173 [Yoonia litorea]
MPEVNIQIPDDVRAMLARATAEQLDRLLWDILCGDEEIAGDARYDA